MKKLLFAFLVMPSVAFSQTYSDDGAGSTETGCFQAPAGTSLKYSVMCNGKYGFGCSFSIGVMDCKTGRFSGASAFIRAKDGQTKTGSFSIRKSGRFYIKAVMGGAWSVKIKKPRK